MSSPAPASASPDAAAPRIVVVGSCMFDQIARAPRLPGPGETLVGSDYATGFGGKGANQAVMAARLGARVAMVGRVGGDDIGRATIDNFRHQCVNTSALGVDARLPSGVAPIWVDEATGQNRILVIPGANLALSPADVRAAAPLLAAARVVVCQLETPLAATREAFTLARAAGATTLLNPAPAAPLPDDLFPLIDFLVPNESELAALAGLPVGDAGQAEAAARVLLARGVRRVLVTLGAQGALLVSRDEASPALLVPAPRVVAVDTTGAGDCFIGAFAYFHARGLPAAESIHRAVRVASISVQARGTQSSFPIAARLPAELLV